MIWIDPEWGDPPELLLKKALEAFDRHLRERLMALSLIAGGQSRTDVAGSSAEAETR